MQKPLMFRRFEKEQNLKEISQGMWQFCNFYLNSGNAAWCIWEVMTMRHDAEKLVSLTGRFVFYFSINSWTDIPFFSVFYVIYFGDGFFFIEKYYQYTIQNLPKCIGDWNKIGM